MFSIGILRHKPVLSLLQPASQFRRIKYLSVVDNPHRLIPVSHRLVAMFEIENAQPPHAKTDIRGGIVIVPDIVRPSMYQRPRHGAHPFGRA
jgi:hypothetical protein